MSIEAFVHSTPIVIGRYRRNMSRSYCKPGRLEMIEFHAIVQNLCRTPSLDANAREQL